MPMEGGGRMTTRRTFMQGAAAMATPMVLGGMPALAASANPRFVLFEESLAPAVAFARRARSHGIATHALEQGDITQAWLNAVRPAWRLGRATVAGLTTSSALFCLEQFACAHRMRVVFHAEHVLRADGAIEHQVQRSRQGVTASALQLAGSRWPQRLADSLLATRPVHATPRGHSLAALEPALPAGATLLTSWVIA